MPTIADQRVPAPRTDPALVERAVRSMAEFMIKLCRHVPGASAHETGGLLCMRSGIPAPEFNGVVGCARDIAADAVVAAVDEFASGNLPWNVQLRPGYPSELDAALTGRGLVKVAQIPLMLLANDRALPAVAHRHRPVVTFNDAAAAYSLLEQGFEMPPELTRGSFPLLMMVMPGVTTWLVDEHETTVSTALGAIHREVVGIFNVATPAEHRGKGYGALATAAAVRQGFDQGCDLAYLQSSPMGYRVYERLGFTEAESWTQWTPREYEDH